MKCSKGVGIVNVFMKTLLWWGNTLNTSMGYEQVEDQAVASSVCDNCHLMSDKGRSIALQELNEGLLTNILCQGCYCPTPVK